MAQIVGGFGVIYGDAGAVLLGGAGDGEAATAESENGDAEVFHQWSEGAHQF